MKYELKEIDIEQVKIKLNLEEFDLSYKTLQVLDFLNMNKDRLLKTNSYMLESFRFMNKEIIEELSREFSSKGYDNLEISDLSYEQYLLNKMGYPSHGFNPSNRIFMFIRRNNLIAEKLKTITYEDLASIRAVGYTIIKEFVDVLNAANIEHSIILPLSKEEKKQIKENEKQELIKILLELILSASNIDILDNPIDKIMFDDYKSYIETLTPKKIEDKIKKIQSKLNK